ncbi:MAG: L,D-transpeptidase [Alphaproteobacteria bacterium]|jgi:lipoprotein-anchoring transpeptidase ErfK/SrfK|nr:L,D-transpeptidase [Alphaproteobacteria bacterium]MBU1562262.1 L,D-transpeptidase [Alphaproteobacteria bacterium]MBU2302766.1 L,D-transpeptidase [Alphaproteobacteria bacterium]MBU2366694.1 L,D-transpeptidase [Alphaproteobacteria bacterium]
MIGLPAVALAACSSTRTPVVQEPMIDPYYQRMYGEVIGEPHRVAAMDLRRVDPVWWRQEVPYMTSERPGTLVVDTPARFLYLVLEGGRALRYGIGVGKDESLVFRGTASIGRKAEWPRWTPTKSMIAREPDRYGPYAGGMEGGETNPLGPRALYLYKNGNDTLFRIHGTTEPYTIGTNVSSGCIRLMNQDIIDLYARVPVGARVVVIN